MKHYDMKMPICLFVALLLSACSFAHQPAVAPDSLEIIKNETSEEITNSPPLKKIENVFPTTSIQSMKIISNDEYLLISGPMKYITRHNIEDHTQLSGYDFTIHPGVIGWPQLFFSRQNVVMNEIGNGRCVLFSSQFEPLLVVSLPLEGGVLYDDAFSADLSRYTVTSKNKEELSIFDTYGKRLWSSKTDHRFADTTHYFGVTAFFDDHDILLCQMIEEHSTYHMIVNTARAEEQPIIISGAEAWKRTPNGFVLCDGYFGVPNAQRKSKTDFIQIELTEVGPRLALKKTPERFAGSDTLLVGELSDILIYSRYLPDEKKRVFYRSNHALEYLGETAVPDPQERLSDLDGICYAQNSYGITPDGKKLLIGSYDEVVTIDLPH